MTLIAIATSDRSADLLTDTTSYSTALRTMGGSTKVMPITHLDAALLTQGDCAFGWALWTVVQALAGDAPDLDALVDELPEHARAIWSSIGNDKDDHEGTCFLVGYSPREGRFQAYGFAAEHDFERWTITGLHVMPSPLNVRPSDLELGRMEGHVHPDDLATLTAMPAPTVPSNAAQWTALGKLAREHRFRASVESGLKVAVAGYLMHTHLSRGHASTKRVFTFDDSGAEFQRMVEGTYHPQAQLGPCVCGSGQRYLDCHLSSHADEPCLCGSEALFRDCCRLGDIPVSTSTKEAVSYGRATSAS